MSRTELFLSMFDAKLLNVRYNNFPIIPKLKPHTILSLSHLSILISVYWQFSENWKEKKSLFVCEILMWLCEIHLTFTPYILGWWNRIEAIGNIMTTLSHNTNDFYNSNSWTLSSQRWDISTTFVAKSVSKWLTHYWTCSHPWTSLDSSSANIILESAIRCKTTTRFFDTRFLTLSNHSETETVSYRYHTSRY